MSDAERIARLELEVKRLAKIVDGLRAAAGKEAVPKGECFKGHDLESGPCPNEGPYGYQRGCRGRSADGKNGCAPANSRYYSVHPRGGQPVETPVKVNGKKAPKASERKGSLFGRSK